MVNLPKTGLYTTYDGAKFVYALVQFVSRPVGVCCPDTITKPVVYREGIFGVKNTIFSRTDGDADVISDSTTPDDVEML